MLRPLVERLPAAVVVEEPEVALAVASALLDRGDQAEAAGLLERAAAAADRVPAERRTRFDVSLCALQLYVARLRGDLETALRRVTRSPRAGRLERDAVDADLRALALLHLGIAELWTGALERGGRASRAGPHGGGRGPPRLARAHGRRPPRPAGRD